MDSPVGPRVPIRFQATMKPTEMHYSARATYRIFGNEKELDSEDGPRVFSQSDSSEVLPSPCDQKTGDKPGQCKNIFEDKRY